MPKQIGKLQSFGFAKETTRGTAKSSAAYWVPFDDLDFDEKGDNVSADQAVGVIEDSIGEYRVKNYADGSFKMPLVDQSVGPLLLSLLGGQAVAAHSGESTVYDHTFTVGESAQHPSLTYFVHDTAGGTDYSYANGVLHKMDIDAQLKKFVQLSCSARSQKGTAQSAFTPSIVAENRFIPQYMTFSSAPTTAGLVTVFAATGTASSTIHVTALSIPTDNIKVGMTVVGTNVPSGATVAAIVSATAFDLSNATTGAGSDFTFGSLAASGTASSTTAVTALSINTNLIKVGMTVTGKFVPAGATVAAIVSSSAFTLSAATTGAMGAITFGPPVVALKNLKLTIDESIEDQEVLGSVAPADFLNKEFKVSGTLEAIYQNLTDFKNAFLATPNVAQAMSIALVNTDVTIGSAANPALIITLDQCYFKELAIKKSPKDLIYQTLKFSATYSLANSEMINIILTNTVSGSY